MITEFMCLDCEGVWRRYPSHCPQCGSENVHEDEVDEQDDFIDNED